MSITINRVIIVVIKSKKLSFFNMILLELGLITFLTATCRKSSRSTFYDSHDLLKVLIDYFDFWQDDSRRNPETVLY